MDKSCICNEGDEQHHHCSDCDCILTGYEINICCWCEDRLQGE